MHQASTSFRRRPLRAHLPLWAPLSVLALGSLARAQDTQFPQPTAKPSEPPKVDPSARFVEFGSTEEFRKQFRIGLQLPESFSLQDQLETYHKSPVDTQRPMLELGRELFREGPLQPGTNWLGAKNPTMWHLMFYGDWRTAAGISDLGSAEIGRLATRLNLDIDFQMTATERVHALLRPFEDGKNLTSFDFTGEVGGDDGRDNDFNVDLDFDALFFEGDAGPLLQGLTGKRNSLDLPFTFGKIPLLFQNGVWLEDAFVGAAATIPAINSPRFDISNMDVTFFAGVDDVSSGAIKNEGVRNEGGTKLVGAATFLETRSGYAEAGWGYAENTGGGPDADAHSLSVAWSQRYFDLVSNSLRAILTVGQEIEPGLLLLAENSFRTRQPYTLLPYVNLFAGFGQPESLARDAGAGGVLKNTGINFEGDALTLFPSLDATGHNRVGAAVGVEYLPSLFTAKHRSQIVLEIAGLHSEDDDAAFDPGDELALGARYQIALTKAWIFRVDAMAGVIEEAPDVSGIRFEVRRKW